MSFLYEIQSGEIIANVKYQVAGTGTGITYNGIDYSIGEYFLGIDGTTDYTKIDGTEIVTEASEFIGFSIGVEEDFFLGKFTDNSTFKGLALGVSDPKPGMVVRTVMPHDVPEKIDSFSVTTNNTGSSVSIDIQYSATTKASYLTVDWGDGSATEDIPVDIYTTLYHTYTIGGEYEITFTGAASGVTIFNASNAYLTKIGNMEFINMTDLNLSNNALTAISLRSVVMNGSLNLNGNNNLSAVEIPTGNASLDFGSCNLTTLDLSTLDIYGELLLYGNPNLESVLFNQNNTGTVTNVNINTCNIQGILDLSYINIQNGDVTFYSNTNLTNIIFKSGSVLNRIIGSSCDITGTVDLSMIDWNSTYGSVTVSLSSNSNLTNVIFPDTTVPTSVTLTSCDLTGTLDLSTQPLRYGISVYSNPNLTEIIPYSGFEQSIIDFTARYCNLTGTLDLSNFDITGSINILSNSNLTEIIFNPNGHSAAVSLTASSCNLTGTLDLSNIPIKTTLDVSNSNNLTDLIVSQIGNELVSYFDISYTNINTDVNLWDMELENTIRIINVPNITSFTFNNTIERDTQYLYLNNTGISSIDLSKLKIRNTLSITDNPNLNNIVWPTTRATYSVTGVTISNNAILDSIDLSNINTSNVTSTFNINNNTALTSINFGGTIVKLSSSSIKYITNNPILQTLDLSNVEIYQGISFEDCTSLNSVTFNSSYDRMSSIIFNNTAMSSIDLSSIPFSYALSVYANDCPNLTSFVGSSQSSAFNQVELERCALESLDISGMHANTTSSYIYVTANNMLATEVDQLLIDLDNNSNSSYPGVLHITTGNDPRTTASDSAYNSLVAKGWTIV
jgi:hypothetical protein